jgi:hypothetical protein
MTDRQVLGVVVRGLGVYFFTIGIQQLWSFLYLAFSRFANETGEYPILQTLSVAVIWFAVSYVLIRRADWIVALAYKVQSEPEGSRS